MAQVCIARKKSDRGKKKSGGKGGPEKPRKEGCNCAGEETLGERKSPRPSETSEFIHTLREKKKEKKKKGTRQGKGHGECHQGKPCKGAGGRVPIGGCQGKCTSLSSKLGSSNRAWKKERFHRKFTLKAMPAEVLEKISVSTGRGATCLFTKGKKKKLPRPVNEEGGGGGPYRLLRIRVRRRKRKGFLRTIGRGPT